LILPLQYGVVLLVRDNRHTPILNNSDRPAILSKPDRLAGHLFPPALWSGLSRVRPAPGRMR
jgi:hypothetical protein